MPISAASLLPGSILQAAIDAARRPPIGGWWLLAGAGLVILLALLLQRRAERDRRRIVGQVDGALARGRDVLQEYREYVDRCVDGGVVPLEPEELYRVHKAMRGLRDLQKKYK